MEQSVRIIRAKENLVHTEDTTMTDEKILGVLADMFVEYDDVTVGGTKDGHHFRIGEVINNITKTEYG